MASDPLIPPTQPIIHTDLLSNFTFSPATAPPASLFETTDSATSSSVSFGFNLEIKNDHRVPVLVEELMTGLSFMLPAASTSTIDITDYEPEYIFQESVTFSTFTIVREARPQRENVERMNIIDAFGHACEHSQLPVVQKRIDAWRAQPSPDFLVNSINHPSNDNELPLVACARLGNDTVISVLLANGADVSKTGSSGRAPLQEACKWGKTSCARLLLEHMRATSSLAVHLDAPSEQDGGRTALHLSVYYGHYDAAELLCGFGADPTTVGDDNKTPLAVGLLFRSARQRVNELLASYYRGAYRRRVEMLVHLTCFKLGDRLNNDVASHIATFLTADDRSIRSFTEDVMLSGMNV
jgi:hypothetical protein